MLKMIDVYVAPGDSPNRVGVEPPEYLVRTLEDAFCPFVEDDVVFDDLNAAMQQLKGE